MKAGMFPGYFSSESPSSEATKHEPSLSFNHSSNNQTLIFPHLQQRFSNIFYD